MRLIIEHVFRMLLILFLLASIALFVAVTSLGQEGAAMGTPAAIAKN